jgi:molecular chaperone GrpE
MGEELNKKRKEKDAVENECSKEVESAKEVGPDNCVESDEQDNLKSELDKIKCELECKTKECAEYFDKLQRTAAEYDNFKKRTQKEKEALYIDAVSDVVSAFLPVIDNVERALKAIPDDQASKNLKDGVEMVFKQLKETFSNIGVEEIKALNEPFDPRLHNAVMHIEDEAYGSNTIIEEFQKGYIYKDKVIRYSVVKVAN